MLKKMLLVVFFLTFAVGAFAQTPVPNPPGTTLLVWDHDGVNVATWTLSVDNAPATPLSPVSKGDGSWEVPFPALTPGAHTLVVSACNVAGCGSSDPFPVNVVVIPAKPTKVRVKVNVPPV